MADEKDIGLITRYLEGALDDETTAEVENRMVQDGEFKSLFEDLKVLTVGIGRVKHKTLLNRMDDLETGLGNPLSKPVETRRVFWSMQRLAAVFAGLAIVALASWFMFGGPGKPNGAELYSEYYVVYENTMVPSTRGEGEVALINRAFQAYDEGAFDKARELFEQLLEVDERLFVKLHAAIVYMELEEPTKAEGLLKEVIEKEEDFATQAQWYLALNYLKTEEYNKSIKMLELLKTTETSYGSQAKELLKDIR